MYTRREVVEHFKKNVWFYTPIAVCLLLAMLWAAETHWHYEKLLGEDEKSTELISKKAAYFNLATGIQAACVWFVIFSLIGLTEKFIAKSNPGTSYFVDSSYWVYLIHRPFCTVFAAILTRWDAPGSLKFLLSLRSFPSSVSCPTITSFEIPGLGFFSTAARNQESSPCPITLVESK